MRAVVQNGYGGPEVVDSTYPLAETPAAMRYLMGRHPRGKVVVVP